MNHNDKEPDPTNDIDALRMFMQDGCDFGTEGDSETAKRLHRALTALVAERDELAARCKAQHEVMTDMVAERDALKQRVAELEKTAFYIPRKHPPADRDRDLRERLVCAALTAIVMAEASYADAAEGAVGYADATLAAMRKGGGA